jgi:hypothetical protein
MKHIFLSLLIVGCGWGEVPLNNQYDIDLDVSEPEQLIAYSDEDIYQMADEFPAIEMFDDDIIKENKDVGLTSFRGENSITR